MKKILFVCSANKQRSKTAEDYFSERNPDFEYFSAGTNLNLCEKEGTNALTENDLIDADLIFVMENKHFQQIKNNTGSKYLKKIEVLNIPDIYKYFQKELIEILKNKVEKKLV